MSVPRTALRAGVRLGAVALTGMLLAACGSGSGGASSDAAGGAVTLTVDLFGSFGYQEAGLYTEYEQLHPGIKIKQTDTEDEQDYWKSSRRASRAAAAWPTSRASRWVGSPRSPSSRPASSWT